MIVKLTSRAGVVRLVDGVRSCSFQERDDAPGRWAFMTMADGTVERALVETWAYVMTDNGTTIEKVSPLIGK